MFSHPNFLQLSIFYIKRKDRKKQRKKRQKTTDRLQILIRKRGKMEQRETQKERGRRITKEVF